MHTEQQSTASLRPTCNLTMAALGGVFLLLLLCLAGPLVAQKSTVRMDNLLLQRVPTGWLVDIAGSATTVYGLERGDSITAINGRNAKYMGPLATLASFNAAFAETVPLTVLHNSSEKHLTLWRGDGAPSKSGHHLDLRNVSLSGSAPDFLLPNLSNVPVRLSSLRGHWVLVSFWATWCSPCRLEAPILDRLAKSNADSLHVLGLAVRDDKAQLLKFKERMHPAYEILNAGPFDAPTALKYGVGSPGGLGSVPVNVLIRPNGQVAYVQGGFEARSPLEEGVLAAMR